MTIDITELFDYDPETGWFTNCFSRGRAKEGERAGSPTGHGYRKITIGYNKYYEHHIAWMYMTGAYPTKEIDHINGDGSDNRFCNLRECTRTLNNFNRKQSTGESGLTGAYLDKRNLQWYSKIQIGGQQKFLGNYNSAEEAHAAYLSAADLHAGEFAFHNRPQPELGGLQWL